MLAACSAAPAPPAASAALSALASATQTSATSAPTSASASAGTVTMKEFPVPAGSGPHDVAPAADGGVWFTAQRSGQLGWLDPKTGRTKMIPLGAGSAPHGVILGPDRAPWITDSGLNAIVRVDPRANDKVTVYKLPGPNVDLNTAVFDIAGDLWFTGQAGYLGRLALSRTDRAPVPEVGAAPGGRGPYGITAQPRTSTTRDVFYASLAGDHIAEIVGIPSESGGLPGIDARPIAPPTRGAGPRRVWSDSKGNIWASEWNAGQVARYDPRRNEWREWKLPGARPQAYAVFVDDKDIVWLSEWSTSAIVRFDPATERFDLFPHAPGGAVRQLNGRPGEVWGALSALDRLLLMTTR